MTRVLAFAAALLAAGAAGPAFAQSQNWHNGYTNPDGTYVQPHWQTNPNSSRTDNWSSRPNVNPHTGRPGTINPYGVQPLPAYPSAPHNNYTNPYAPRRR